MVRCLAYNDLVALLGSFLLMYMHLYMPTNLVTSRWFCAIRVILRTFGLSSGCVAVVMAVERWLALTRPFFYHKQVTYKLIKRAIFSLWIVVLILDCLPFVGFGVYYEKSECTRYKNATKTKDIAYAYVIFVFGMFLCVVIVCCNLAVVRVLCRMGKKNLERLGRTAMRKDSNELSFNHTTPEEVSFAKLMIMICVFFVICWVPQLITIIIAQMKPNTKINLFYKIADGCIALNFTLDPIVYVLSRKPHRKGLRKLLKPICHLCWPQTNRNSSIRSNTQELSKSTKEVNQNSLDSNPLNECIALGEIARQKKELEVKNDLSNINKLQI
ncbi:rhodopsin, GQ-coupled-like isoform X1 [Centruroides vittatus]|uniref:rhodopsin, GQ-coupled-like isoform X1 n=1 Tax=Centruroides vittatus TaxID=120091 RepID=UPI00350F98D3